MTATDLMLADGECAVMESGVLDPLDDQDWYLVGSGACWLDGVTVEAWLDFAGIYVQPDSMPVTVEAAAGLLSQFTDPTGLVGVERSHNYVFRLEVDAEEP